MTEIGFETEWRFRPQIRHGLGLRCRAPARLALDPSIEPTSQGWKPVFAVETFWPAKDGISAARIEEEVVLTPDGAKIISLYPAKELPVANPY
jgi:Xaa-Pro dipeptidase